MPSETHVVKLEYSNALVMAQLYWMGPIPNFKASLSSRHHPRHFFAHRSSVRGYDRYGHTELQLCLLGNTSKPNGIQSSFCRAPPSTTSRMLGSNKNFKKTTKNDPPREYNHSAEVWNIVTVVYRQRMLFQPPRKTLAADVTLTRAEMQDPPLNRQ